MSWLITHSRSVSWRAVVTSVLGIVLSGAAFAATPAQVLYTEPAAGTMPPFGSVPFPSNLYYDGGAPTAGDGTLINKDPGNADGGYEKFGIETLVLPLQDRALLAGLDRLDGFGVTTPVWFFFDGSIDESSLPGTPVVNNGRVQVSPTQNDSVFLVEVDSQPAELIPLKFRFNFDTRIANALAMVPLEGVVLKANTTYAAVVTNKLRADKKNSVESTDDFEAAKGGATLSAAAAYVTGTLGVPTDDIVGMTVFRTQTTSATLAVVRTGVVDACPTTVDFSGGLIFTDAGVDTFFGPDVAPNVGLVASGFYSSPRLQGLDPTNHSHRDGSGGIEENDLPVGLLAEIDDEQFQDLGSNGGGCNLTVLGAPDGLPDVVDVDPSTPDTLDMARVPVSLAVPAGTPPTNGWPVIIIQHGLGGHRSTTLSLADIAAQQGFAVIGIDAVDHGLRWDETDTVINFTDAPGSDGLPDGDLAAVVNFGFFEAFSNIAAIRDNFRQTYVDLMALVRTLSLDEFDSAVGVDLDPDNIFYLGISLGALMGSGTTPYVPEVRAVLLDAAGGGQSAELLINSTIGAGALSLLQAVFGLDPNNGFGDFSFFSALAQSIVDAGDGTVNAVHFFKEPFPSPFRPMNVILLQDMNDQVVPNQANEALAFAAGFDLFDPHVKNLVETTRPLQVASTTGFVEGNINGTTTAAVFQVGPGAHAVLTDTISTLSLVPGFATIDEFRDADLQSIFPTLIRNVRVRVPGVVDDVLDWFSDVIDRGTPGRFEYTGPDPDFNTFESQNIGEDGGTFTFFERTVNATGAAPYQESTPPVSITIGDKSVAGRMTVTRSTLGTSADADDADMPPLATTTTPNVLPFFVGIQRPDAPAYEGADLTITYTDAELAASACSEPDLFVARFNSLTESYDKLSTAVDASANQARVLGFEGADGVYGVFCGTSGLPFSNLMDGTTLKVVLPKNPNAPRKLVAKVTLVDPTGTLEIDPTQSDILVTLWEDRDTVLFSQPLNKDCWVNSGTNSSFSPTNCGGAAGVFRKAKMIEKAKNGQKTFKFIIQAKGDLGGIENITKGGGGTQVQLTVDGVEYHTSGGRCKSKSTKIACSKYNGV